MAQTSEKMLALKLICQAVDALQIPYIYKGNGRPSIGLDDMLKCCAIKVFNNFSSRRTMGEIEIAYALQYIREIPHFNSINNYLQKEEIVPWLHKLYKILAMPLVEIEEDFAVDATGFTSLKKKHWLEFKFATSSRKEWKKLHVVSGVRTNVVTSARVTESRRNDHTQYEDMVIETSRNFRMREVSADPAYLSRKNCSITEECGARPFILPKSNTHLEMDGYHLKYPKVVAWLRMIQFWKDNKELFLQHYHKRSNVESTFSAMKRKFLPYVRSRSDRAQSNEILCKVVCFNASVLCTAMFELGVNLNFKGMR